MKENIKSGTVLYLIKLILKDKLYAWSLIAIIFLIFLQFLAIAFFYKYIPPQIPIFYSQPWGQEQLAGKKLIFLFPIQLILLLIINYFLAAFFFLKEKLLAKFFIFGVSLAAVLLSIAFFKILSLTAF